MRLFSRGCESRQDAYLAVAGGLGVRERIALEAHAARCADCADGLRNGRPVDSALRGAFSPLRERRTIIAPGRVRMAIGPNAPAPTIWLRAPRLFGRLAEVSVMIGVTMFAVGSSLEPAVPEPDSVAPAHTVVLDAFYARGPLPELDYLRWLRLVKPDASQTASTTSRLPMGGRFDEDPVEIQKGMGASPR